MKQITNKKLSKSALKGGLLTLLLAALVANGFAEERSGVVIDQFEYLGVAISFVDENDDGVPDIAIEVPYATKNAFFGRVSRLLAPGSTVVYDNNQQSWEDILQINAIGYGSVLGVNGQSMTKYFPKSPTDFPHAFAKEREAQQAASETR